MTNEISDACDLYGHGGNIYRLAGELGMQERQITDFSASVNPLGVSKKVKAELRKHLKYLDNYPDPEAGRLRKRLAQYHGIDTETILCGNGSTGLIYLITRGLKPQRVLIPAPTFSEYERACTTSCKSQVTSYELKKENNFDIDCDDFIKAMEGKLPNPPSPLPDGRQAGPFTKGGQGGINSVYKRKTSASSPSSKPSSFIPIRINPLAWTKCAIAPDFPKMG